jgi:hypothetical protein
MEKKRQGGRTEWFADEYSMGVLKSHIVGYNKDIHDWKQWIKTLQRYRQWSLIQPLQTAIKEYHTVIKAREKECFECQPLIATELLIQFSNMGLDVDFRITDPSEIVPPRIIEPVTVVDLY